MSQKHHAVVVSSPASIESLETRRLLSHSANVTVDNGVGFQTIDGLGASPAGAMNGDCMLPLIDGLAGPIPGPTPDKLGFAGIGAGVRSGAACGGGWASRRPRSPPPTRPGS